MKYAFIFIKKKKLFLRHLWHYRIIFRCLEDLYWMCWEEKHGYDENIGESYHNKLLHNVIAHRK